MYPLLFNHILKNKIWGGKKLDKFLNLEKTDNLIGESWEISARPENNSIITNGLLKGKTLQEVYDEYKDKLVGKKVYNKFENKFPILIKFLDINDRLSIQVHPNNEYAKKRHNDFGKNECWYVIEASEDAKIYLDTNKNYTKDEIIEKMHKNDFSDLFNIRNVKKGDFIDITPGTIHASISGSVFLAEIQQNSDITYRIYDFDRLENGKKRELHLKDAINVIDFNKETNIISLNNDKLKNNLTKNDFFTINKINLNNDKYTIINYESMVIITIIEGLFTMKYSDENMILKKGMNILIPVSIKVEIIGNGIFLETYIEE